MTWRLATLSGLLLLGACALDSEPSPVEVGASDANAANPVRAELELPDVFLDSYEPAVRGALEAARVEAEAKLEAAAVDDAARAEALGELGRVYLAHSLEEAADLCLRQAWQYDASQPDWPFLLGYLRGERGEFESSLEPLTAARERAPEDGSVRLLLARAYLAMDRLEEADRLLGSASDTEDPLVLLELGKLARARGAHEEAVALLERVTALAPSAGNAFYPLGLSYRALGREKEARAALALRSSGTLRLQDPRIADLSEQVVGYRVLNRLGNEAFLAGRFEEAVENFQAALEVDAEQPRIRVNLAAALARLGQVGEAEAELRRAIELDPENGQAHFNLGALLARGGRIDEARRSYRRATELDPENPDVFYNFGNLQLRSGQAVEAERRYRQALELDPASGPARYGLALSQIRQESWSRAVEELRIAVDLLPAEAPLRGLLSRVLVAAPVEVVRDPDEALQLARALFDEQSSIDNSQTLVLALVANGELVEAEALAQRAIEALEASGQPADGVRSVLAAIQGGQPLDSLLPWKALP